MLRRGGVGSPRRSATATAATRCLEGGSQVLRRMRSSWLGSYLSSGTCHLTIARCRWIPCPSLVEGLSGLVGLRCSPSSGSCWLRFLLAPVLAGSGSHIRMGAVVDSDKWREWPRNAANASQMPPTFMNDDERAARLISNHGDYWMAIREPVRGRWPVPSLRAFVHCVRDRAPEPTRSVRRRRASQPRSDAGPRR
jgi:hypothetical protein